jgi:hypothetical protein
MTEQERARRRLITGDPAYLRAFTKYLRQRPMTAEEKRVLETGREGKGYMLPRIMDPTWNERED